MLLEFQKHIETEFPELNNRHIAVAISGGVDSVVLAHLFCVSGLKVSLLHCNFKLRPNESDTDQLFVEEFAKKLKVSFFTTEFDTKSYVEENKLSIQVAARQLRYNWFQEIAKKHQMHFIATAHHADDNLETFLINVLRGTGIEGLTGIPKKNVNVIRPLLNFSKNEILAYAEKNKLSWREDASNKETKYVRNKLRHQVIPALKEIQPNILQNFESTSLHLQQANNFLKDVIQQKKDSFFIEDDTTGGYKISVEDLKKEKHVALLIFEFFKPFGFTSFSDIQNLLTAQSGKQVVSNSYILLKNRTHLLLYAKTSTEVKQQTVITEKDKSISIGNFRLLLTVVANKAENLEEEIVEKSKNTIFLNIETISFPLFVRKKEKADYFYPTGMKGKKKLSKYFKDEKMSIPEKENTWLLCTKTDIIWVIGKRLDRRFGVNPETKQILKITYEKIY